MGEALKDWVDRTHPTNRAVFDDVLPSGTKTLVISARSTTVPRAPFVEADNFILQIELKNQRAGTYARRFSLGPWGSFTFGVEPFEAFTLWILRAPSPTSGIPFSLVIEASTGEEAQQQPALLYPETVDPGVWCVPWGAFELLPAVSDPSFVWNTNDVAGAVISIPAPAVAGVPLPVQGLRYEPSVSFTGLWRIRP